LKANHKTTVSIFLSAAVMLLVVQSASSQIQIRGFIIPGTTEVKPAAGFKNTATATEQNDPPGLLSYFLSEISEARKDVDIYDPAERLYLVKAVQEEWVLRAVSQRARAEHAAQMKYTGWREANPGNQLDTALDELAASVAKKLPIYKPGVAAFQFRNPVAEKLLMGYFKNTAAMKIHRIGVGSAGWLIQKDSSGLPSYRYKFANVYYRDSSDDHPFCHRVSVRVKQDYAGGGTYSTEVYRSSAEDELFGCP
jgi:hypothetical protein